MSDSIVLIVGSESSGSQMLERWITQCRTPRNLKRESPGVYESHFVPCGDCWHCTLDVLRWSMPHGNRTRDESHWPDAHDFGIRYTWWDRPQIADYTHVIWTRRVPWETARSKVNRGHCETIEQALAEIEEAETRILHWLGRRSTVIDLQTLDDVVIHGPALLVVQYEAIRLADTHGGYPALLADFLDYPDDHMDPPMTIHDTSSKHERENA